MLHRITIVYASQTGRSQELAEFLFRRLEACNAVQMRVRNLSSFSAKELTDEQLVIAFVSTTGQGDNPDSMRAFWRFLSRKDLPEKLLAPVKFAVFGLGDSSYVRFNFPAKRLFRRLQSLGAQDIVRRGDGDDQHPLGVLGTLYEWLGELWPALCSLFPDVFQATDANPLLASPAVLPPPRYSFTVGGDSLTSSSSVSASPPTTTSSSVERHYIATLEENRRLTSPLCEQDVRHLAFACPDVAFQPGDVASIRPQNSPDSVEAFFARNAHMRPDALITSIAAADENDDRWTFAPLPCTLRSLLTTAVDFNGMARSYFFECLAFLTEAPHEVARLRYFGSPEGQADLRRYCHKERRSFLEVLVDFPGVVLPFDYLLDLLSPIQPRQFSISSSLRAHPDALHLTVAIVRFSTPTKRPKLGLCSNYLAELAPGARLDVGIRRGSIALPANPRTPLLLVGPGTGIAPFRAFMQQLRGGGTPVALFFGCRYKDQDVLYRSEFEELYRSGDLAIWDPAYSRDQPDKVYVQHKIGAHARQVVDLIKAGAQLYICGSANQMPQDVQHIVKQIFETSDLESTVMPFDRYAQTRLHLDTWS